MTSASALPVADLVHRAARDAPTRRAAVLGAKSTAAATAARARRVVPRAQVDSSLTERVVVAKGVVRLRGARTA
jgi:hypothetical protein